MAQAQEKNEGFQVESGVILFHNQALKPGGAFNRVVVLSIQGRAHTAPTESDRTWRGTAPRRSVASSEKQGSS